MKTERERQTHTLDAKDASVGRLATQAAILLRGKHRPDFAPYKDTGDYVVIQNVKDMRFSGKKLGQKVFYRHTGYLGSLKKDRLEEMVEENPAEVVRRAVWGMLPKNKLRALQIKRLKIEA